MNIISFAQSTTTDNVANVDSKLSTSSNNSSIAELSIDERMAIAQKAINDYLSGKTDDLVIPGATKIEVTLTPLTTPPVKRLAPAPDYLNATLITPAQQEDWLSQINMVQSDSVWLPVFAGDSDNYSATYVQFGGPGYGTNASSANAQFNYAYNGLSKRD